MKLLVPLIRNWFSKRRLNYEKNNMFTAVSTVYLLGYRL